jgi:hypothetical protein
VRPQALLDQLLAASSSGKKAGKGLTWQRKQLQAEEENVLGADVAAWLRR